MNFEDIRPYNDSEYRQIIKKLLSEKVFIDAIKFYLPELSFSEIKEKLLFFNTIDDFQSNLVCFLIEKIIAHSMDGISFEGREFISKDENYLYLSNHRDIVLDSALINFGLNEKKFNTIEIAIGSNLLTIPWVKDLVRLNKSFIVKRDVSKQESLQASKTLSAYLHYTLKQKKESIWIAQREGRAKDGFDKTNPGLLKMFGLSATNNTLDDLISMNIRPVSIAYEYDPCDYLKLPELIAKHNNEIYSKSPNEDFQHMSLGIKGYKGHVNITYGQSINNDILKFKAIKNRNELLKNISTVIDNIIYKNYHLFNSNYVAYDLLYLTNKYAHKYAKNGKEKFLDYMNDKLKDYSNNKLAKELFLKMYANPVINKNG